MLVTCLIDFAGLGNFRRLQMWRSGTRCKESWDDNAKVASGLQTLHRHHRQRLPQQYKTHKTHTHIFPNQSRSLMQTVFSLVFMVFMVLWFLHLFSPIITMVWPTCAGILPSPLSYEAQMMAPDKPGRAGVLITKLGSHGKSQKVCRFHTWGGCIKPFR